MIITKAGEAMTLDEAIECLGKIGVDVSKATLNRYVRDGLVTAPERGGYGRGGGRWANYSVSAVAEAATAWAMLTKKTQTEELFKELQYLRFTPEMVAKARNTGMFKFYRDSLNEMRKYCPSEFLQDLNTMDKVYEVDRELLDIEKTLEEKCEAISLDEWRELSKKKKILEVNLRELEKDSNDYIARTGIMYTDEENINEKVLTPILGNVSIPDFFPKNTWSGSVAVIELFLWFVAENVFVKIYGGMMIRLLNVIPKNK